MESGPGRWAYLFGRAFMWALMVVLGREVYGVLYDGGTVLNDLNELGCVGACGECA